MRDCERYLNDPNVTSDSLKDGIRDLMSKSEENFGTLLHLERVSSIEMNILLGLGILVY